LWLVVVVRDMTPLVVVELEVTELAQRYQSLLAQNIPLQLEPVVLELHRLLLAVMELIPHLALLRLTAVGAVQD
jgi:hypothetical protein